MWISKFRVRNFSAFKDTGDIELSEGFNIFAGQNNAGKSALLKAISLQIDGNPHRSPENYIEATLPQSTLHFEVKATVSEIYDRLTSQGSPTIFPAGDGAPRHRNLLSKILKRTDELSLKGVKSAGAETMPDGPATIPELVGATSTSSVKIKKEDGNFVVASGGAKENIIKILSYGDRGSIFYFSPERLNISSFQFSFETRLKSDASNLPAVLAYLQGSRRQIFDEIEENLLSIVPGISRMTVTPDQGGFEVLLWPHADTSRRELSFRLNESGTGVGQVLAILTAVVSSPQSVIVIDEINTFLHPSASKKLLRLLRTNYSYHQYIISTHSSDVLSSCISDNVYLLSRDGFEAEVKAIDLSDFRASRQVAGHLGFSMMDVFGHERLVWVEGQTEELCIPFLLKSMGADLHGIGFVAVASTDQFSNRGASKKSVIDLYDQVARTAAPLLKGMAFGIDRERLSDEAVRALEQSKRKLRFLPYRALENFFLDIDVLAETISNVAEQRFSSRQIKDFLFENGSDAKYGAATFWKSNLSDEIWLKKVDGPKLISDLFSSLTEHRYEFRKTTHSIELLKTAITRNSPSIDPLRDFSSKLLDTARRNTPP